MVAEFTIFQQNTADLVGFHEQAKSAKYCGASHARQGGAEVLGGERSALGCCGTDDEASWFGVAVPHAGEVSDDVIDDGGRARPWMQVAGVFWVVADQMRLRIVILGL